MAEPFSERTGYVPMELQDGSQLNEVKVWLQLATLQRMPVWCLCICTLRVSARCSFLITFPPHLSYTENWLFLFHEFSFEFFTEVPSTPVIKFTAVRIGKIESFGCEATQCLAQHQVPAPVAHCLGDMGWARVNFASTCKQNLLCLFVTSVLFIYLGNTVGCLCPKQEQNIP